MPRCFQLISKETQQAVDFQTIDEEICAHFGVPVDPVNWYENWYNIIGLCLACGHKFDYLIENDFSQKIQDITKFLMQHYESTAWYQPK